MPQELVSNSEPKNEIGAHRQLLAVMQDIPVPVGQCPSDMSIKRSSTEFPEESLAPKQKTGQMWVPVS